MTIPEPVLALLREEVSKENHFVVVPGPSPWWYVAGLTLECYDFQGETSAAAREECRRLNLAYQAGLLQGRILLWQKEQEERWIPVEERLPEDAGKTYRIAVICRKQYDSKSNYPGEGIWRVLQDWNVRMWPQNFTHWKPLPPPPTK